MTQRKSDQNSYTILIVLKNESCNNDVNIDIVDDNVVDDVAGKYLIHSDYWTTIDVTESVCDVTPIK